MAIKFIIFILVSVMMYFEMKAIEWLEDTIRKKRQQKEEGKEQD